MKGILLHYILIYSLFYIFEVIIDFFYLLRLCIWEKAADLMAGVYRQELNAATMLGQSKTVIQAEIDSAAELIDFIRYMELKLIEDVI